MTIKRISSGAGLPAGFRFSPAPVGAKIEFQAVAAVRE
jgi:hypothetical protein